MPDPSQHIERNDALLLVQKALVGRVDPALRGVAVSWGRRRIGARFLYESAGDLQTELVLEAETEVMADVDDDATTEFNLLIVGDEPLVLLDAEAWAFRRHEP